MELTANRRPFIFFPLRHHFEQNFHVRHRLERYRAGRCMDYETATPESIAAAIAEEIGREVDYLPVEPGGAARAAAQHRRAALIERPPRITAMAVRSPSQLANRARIESVLRLAAPALDILLAAGDRISRVAGRNQIEPEPSRRSLRAEVRTPLGGGPDRA